MTEMEWALFGLRYLAEGRAAIHEEFNGVMLEVPQYAQARTESWYPVCKSIVPSLYHYSMEFAADSAIPGSNFSFPTMFAEKLIGYKVFVEKMDAELEEQVNLHAKKIAFPGEPSLVYAAKKMVVYILDGINYVISQKPASNAGAGTTTDVDFVVQLSQRFHEAVLSLKKHPHSGDI